jgi:uncharacterized protein (DUF362 family)/Pyruvate/2-oxoacid:ferredoxin oxidoreductase delta subunit
MGTRGGIACPPWPGLETAKEFPSEAWQTLDVLKDCPTLERAGAVDYSAGMPVVGLERGVRYDADGLRRAIRKVLAPLGGIAAFVRSGERVLVKPNIVAPARPDTGICTHPLFVRAVCDLVAECRPARIHVGDMSGYNFLGDGRRCAEGSGLAAALAGGPARIVPFEGTHVRISSEKFRVFRHIDLTREVLDADVVISLPTPKSHRLTRFSGAVKNVFGCVSYGTRERIHKMGDYRTFCDGLVDIFEYVRPALTIADMVRVQEGNGPCTGDPLDVGVALAAADGVALDAVSQYLLGMEPEDVLTTVLAHVRGAGECDLGRIEVAGPPDWRRARVAARRPGRFHSFLQFGLPVPVLKVLASSVRARPVFQSGKCGGCELCLERCPGHALSRRGTRIRRDRKACLLCFGCVAVCPRGAAATRWDPVSAWNKRLAEKFLR